MAHVAIDWNKYMNGLAGKANVALNNVSANVDFVVESKVNTDGSWYRMYKSGWLEQGGTKVTAAPNTPFRINLLKPYTNNNYKVLLTDFAAVNASTYLGYWNKQTTSFEVVCPVLNRAFDWYAFGPGANFANEGILEPGPGPEDILG